MHINYETKFGNQYYSKLYNRHEHCKAANILITQLEPTDIQWSYGDFSLLKGKHTHKTSLAFFTSSVSTSSMRNY